MIELQRVRQDFFKDRVLFYSTFPIRDQNEKGVWGFRLKAVYCILILDFQLPQENKVGNNSRVLHEIQLKDQDGRLFYDKLFYLYLEMPNFKLDLHEVRTSLDKWLYIIKHLKNMKNVPDIFKNTLFEDVLEKAAIDNLSEAEYTAYHSSLKQYRDLKNGLDFAFHNGRTEGEAIGFVKGEEIGRNEGKKEEKILIAKKMKSNGVSIQNIIEYTGLREDEINLL